MSRAGEDGGKAAAASPLRPTAVVVNDNRIQLKVLAKMVKQAGLEPLAFPSVEEAFAAMDPRHPPALIVTDVDMPGIDGWGFCRLLRSKEYAAFNAVPILVGSATFGETSPRASRPIWARRPSSPFPWTPNRSSSSCRRSCGGSGSGSPCAS